MFPGESGVDIHLRDTSDPSTGKTKPPPKKSLIPVPFSYTPSDDGTDENILILFHGLGDSHVPFGKLGRQLKLPQTATLALQAPEQIPFLYEQAFQWYPSFDPLGELIDRPNPTPALDLTLKVLNHLIQDCSWPPHRIHLFGFAQGGSVAAELCIKWWKQEAEKHVKSPGTPIRALGSLVTVSGPLLSYPTLSKACSTPVLVFHRPAPSESALPSSAMTAFGRAFGRIKEVKMSGEGMPRSRDEWEPIMRFWSEQLGRRQGNGLYEVMTGVAGEVHKP
ncbi:hypothetical protein SERLA73DRAFT_50932 [Serpula lacrymans var. lacrymans S7.3]|uniref:Phospholipase/carboxylesterase/thioesterase domain-containing protein n=2 Tax=Serpula lacrymans var. lacrymans TaxID=341189 RepID=F8PTT3_SERL3|nr:uncharacterized protein SERLADRAFT_368254 [Serpula lacrymans var. lacrymans S7.9]EGO01078.1 hypothetical protein SERLA73DRAFT_50932 [Serpula lacrymans var. lacrymans S7.3]EGO26736.1 hypothetical protein SERLADRAFT_368254 [Serpula lacrymans var. lacrymans S7.9]